MKIVLTLFLLFPKASFSTGAMDLIYKNFFGHLHEGPSAYSSSLKTLSCGDRLEVIQSKNEVHTEFSKFAWVRVKHGPDSGFIRKDFLAKNYRDCFQYRFPRFFSEFKLKLGEIFSWGRLFDQYVMGKAKVR